MRTRISFVHETCELNDNLNGATCEVELVNYLTYFPVYLAFSFALGKLHLIVSNGLIRKPHLANNSNSNKIRRFLRWFALKSLPCVTDVLFQVQDRINWSEFSVTFCNFNNAWFICIDEQLGISPQNQFIDLNLQLFGGLEITVPPNFSLNKSTEVLKIIMMHQFVEKICLVNRFYTISTT